MLCEKHSWDFHAELNDETIIRWCGKCGGLQTFPKPRKSDLSLDRVGFLKDEHTKTSVQLPEMVKNDDGLFSEGVVKEHQPELRGLYSNRPWSRFKNPWSANDSGELVQNKCRYVCEDIDLTEAKILSGVLDVKDYKGN